MEKVKKKVEVDLNKLSFNELKQKIEELENQRKEVKSEKVGAWFVGKNYFIRTVTMSLMGKLEQVTDNELVLSQASWIADTGRFSDFLEGKFDSNLEVEPFPGSVIVGRGSLIDACLWEHALLRDKK